MGNTNPAPKKENSPASNPQEKKRSSDFKFLCDWNAEDPALPTIIGMKNVRRNLEASFHLPRLQPDFCKSIKPIRALLMWGPPGTGKTLVVKRFAKAIKYDFVSVVPNEIFKKWQGDTEHKITQIFNEAMQKPTILFLDEIDSYAKQRQSEEAQHVTTMKTTLLLKLQHFVDSQQTQSIVVACTNTVSDLDDAVRRRFSTTIYVDLPDQQEREELLARLLDEAQTTLTKQEIAGLAKKMERFSGSDITSLVQNVTKAPLMEVQVATYFRTDSRNKWVPCSSCDDGAQQKYLAEIPENQLACRRPITKNDFDVALRSVQPTLNQQAYLKFKQEVERIGGDMSNHIERVDRQVGIQCPDIWIQQSQRKSFFAHDLFAIYCAHNHLHIRLVSPESAQKKNANVTSSS